MFQMSFNIGKYKFLKKYPFRQFWLIFPGVLWVTWWNISKIVFCHCISKFHWKKCTMSYEVTRQHLKTVDTRHLLDVDFMSILRLVPAKYKNCIRKDVYVNTSNICFLYVIYFKNSSYIFKYFVTLAELSLNPHSIYLFKVNNRNTRKRCEIC